ncbi:MAG: acyl-CoA dehydratase activase [Desulfobacterales bacterium]
MGSNHILGIDIGSVSISLALVTPAQDIVQTGYGFHHGDIPACLETLLADVDIFSIAGVAATDGTPELIFADQRYDHQISLIRAVKAFHPEAAGILTVGGEKFKRIRFDDNGEYAGSRTNTACAAGTGSFLDQQASRLNLAGIGELSRLALANTHRIPKIATRCAVFAKTDLIHAQQEGYELPEICEGLCRGLAKNLADTLFFDDQPAGPLIFCGGVSRNAAVLNHISELTGAEIFIDDMSHLYEAIGAAFHLIDEGADFFPGRFTEAPDLLYARSSRKQCDNPPLQVTLSDYPAFESLESYHFNTADDTYQNAVEVDVYEALTGEAPVAMYIGMDIGSTSTKAVWLNPEKTVLAGFYTKTAGRPVDSMRGVLAAMDDLINARGLSVNILGVGTTGSGRKFVGRIMGADLIIDEITAHARAACELNPDVDTIIEIGGQDSKFTTLKDGMVTSSIMNTVCAAGTGSFIEEQAQKLGCPLSEYAERAEKLWSPLANDRCTVFMERDINYYLSRGYTVDEVLATALHSVRENYLTKVAEESRIGDVVFFQGATAKNRALVAAFEQRLNKPILVSRFCHLTGAMGTALQMADDGVCETNFRGISLYREKIPVRSEVCNFCTNHCKITIAEMADGPVAFGFLCGRDYDTHHFVNNNTSGFDLIKTRNKVFSYKPENGDPQEVTVGIPAALYLYEDVECWRKFFDWFGIRTVTSEKCPDAVKTGKQHTGAEFCAPISALHGHAAYLLERADYIFMPFYLDNREKDTSARRQYCYYSQFVPSLVSEMTTDKDRFLMPVLKYIYNAFHARIQLFNMLKRIAKRHINYFEVASAYEQAFAHKTKALERLRGIYVDESASAADISVALLGRPYTILPPKMNKGIPDIFAAFGIKTFFQDMMVSPHDPHAEIKPLLEEVHWNYAADIICAATVAARTPGLYPVFITSFKCAPDAFVKGVIKDLMSACQKPYLMLELDEHDSSVGYETRIEAAIRAFRNHWKMKAAEASNKSPAALKRINPEHHQTLSGRTLVLPDWDPLTCPLLVENLKREGIDARLMDQTPEMVQQSMGLNGGQCIPINVIVKGYVDYIQNHNLEPAKTLLWMGKSDIACHLGMYPYELKQILNSYSHEMKQTGVYSGPISFTDISLRAAINTYFAFMFGGVLRKLACKIRPYETVKGATDRVTDESLAVLGEAFSGRRSKESAVSDVVARFEEIPVQRESRPKAAIFGDLFVRDNPVMNQDLLHFIEACGGEAITTPYTDYAKMVARAYFKKWFTEGRYLELIRSKTLLIGLAHLEKTYFRYFNRILNEAEPAYDAPAEKILAPYRMIAEQTGESMDNILKVYYLTRHHPDLSLFIQTSPALCCPSLVTEAMASEIETETGIPVVSLTYDGTWSEKNHAIIPYLKFPRQGSAGSGKAGRLTKAG